ncbi:MAG: hypothetical protein J1G01_01665 [Clostridiales bacterium]|nr:hypothetical protein [Clostridiales bacterium]
MANNQPVIFDLKYTPYSPSKKATDYQRNKNATERAFFDMTGEDNIYKYITTEGKRTGKKFTALDYLQKNTGVFNQNGMIPQEEVDAMKARAKVNKGNIWHGFISFNEHDSAKIDTPEKCIQLVKDVFPTFLRDSGLNPNNIDLMCALHLDRPHHLHIHFVFWEKAPMHRNNDGTLGYRNKGNISRKAIDNMFVRLGLFADDKRDDLHKARDNAMKRLKKMTNVKTAMHTTAEIKQEILSLAKDLPRTGRFVAYGSKELEPYRERVDRIVKMLLEYDSRAEKANRRFYEQLEERRRVIKNICGQDYALSGANTTPQKVERELPKYHHKIDESHIKIIETIEADYKRRQGNLVLKLCKFIKPEYFERDPNKRYKANDNKLKRRLGISHRNVGRRFGKFFRSFGPECELLERDFSQRLQEIEREIEQERERQAKAETQQLKKEENNKY